jgi:hypothetical protein
LLIVEIFVCCRLGNGRQTKEYMKKASGMLLIYFISLIRLLDQFSK